MKHVKKGLCILAVLLLSVYTITVSASTMYTTDTVHMRTGPSTSHKIITTLGKNTAIVVYGYEDNWADVSYNGKEGYIRKDFLSKSSGSSSKSSGNSSSKKKTASKKKTSSVSQGSAKINADDVNLRKKAKGSVISQLNKGDKVSVISKGKDWSKVKTSDGTTGYVYNSYLGNYVSRSDVIKKYRAAAIEYCEDHIDDKYSQEKRDKKGYCDCSSLMRDAYDSVSGQFIGDNTVEQNDTMKKYLYKLKNIYDATAGDIVYHMSEEGEYHCGIYIGDGAVINASKTVGHVKISYYDETSTYWEIGCKAASFCYDEKYGK